MRLCACRKSAESACGSIGFALAECSAVPPVVLLLLMRVAVRSSCLSSPSDVSQGGVSHLDRYDRCEEASASFEPPVDKSEGWLVVGLAETAGVFEGAFMREAFNKRTN